MTGDERVAEARKLARDMAYLSYLIESRPEQFRNPAAYRALATTHQRLAQWAGKANEQDERTPGGDA